MRTQLRTRWHGLLADKTWKRLALHDRGQRTMLSTRHRKIGSVPGLFLVLILALTWQMNLGSDIALAQGGGPYGIWDDTATPAILSVNDPSAIEVGVKFQADEDGYITVHTTFGPVTFPIFAYRDMTTPLAR